MFIELYFFLLYQMVNFSPSDQLDNVQNDLKLIHIAIIR